MQSFLRQKLFLRLQVSLMLVVQMQTQVTKLSELEEQEESIASALLCGSYFFAAPSEMQAC